MGVWISGVTGGERSSLAGLKRPVSHVRFGAIQLEYLDFTKLKGAVSRVALPPHGS